MSAGIFIYITFMSMLPEEFNKTVDSNEGNYCWKVLAFTSGWTIMSILSFVVSE